MKDNTFTIVLPDFVRDSKNRSVTPATSQIKNERVMAGLTQAEAARLIYKTLSAWQKWEGGQRIMDAALWELFLIKINDRPAKASCLPTLYKKPIKLFLSYSFDDTGYKNFAVKSSAKFLTAHESRNIVQIFQ